MVESSALPPVRARGIDGVSRTAGGRLRLLVLQPTPFCNIDCSYCYLSTRNSKARMTLDTLAKACRCVFDGSNLDEALEIAWHGGEPLTVPLQWYKDAVALISDLRPVGLNLKYRFQTNGLLLNAEWVDFLETIGAVVGLSIDGPADLHDARRRSRGGLGTHEKAMDAVRLLHGRGLPFHVITVLTSSTLASPDQLFEFYRSNGIAEVGFNVEEIEGDNRSSSLSGSNTDMRFRKFIRRFFDLCIENPGAILLRELEATVSLLLAEDQAEDEQNIPFRIISVGHDGAISTFSPELLGSHHDRFESFVFGHVENGQISKILYDDNFKQVHAEIQQGVDACRRICSYFKWCGGGAPANKLFELGRFDTTETLHCRLSRQIILDETVALLERSSRHQVGQCEGAAGVI
ncbi:cyclophane-forming radical SAM/SPASM peptide maturase GrrM/OscB [Microvirga sp. M2]|uniref:cyclophane-forming radical SAM/SPASM peptide maturase GrrM/OscB n=1 Tax=Microvirga sp. M2 TaxID=3073270 RepID=UPI0039C27A85